MKIIYFHGFGSSGASGTVETLRRLLPEVTIVAPDIPVDPVDALPFLIQFCQDEQPDLIIGTSMGGHVCPANARLSTHLRQSSLQHVNQEQCAKDWCPQVF